MPYIARDPAHMGVTGEENHGHQSWPLLICYTGGRRCCQGITPSQQTHSPMHRVLIKLASSFMQWVTFVGPSQKIFILLIEAFSINIGLQESFPLFGPGTNSKLNPKLNFKKELNQT